MNHNLGIRRNWRRSIWLWLFLFIMLLALVNYVVGATSSCPGCCRVYF